MSGRILIELQDITSGFRNIQILKNISWRIKKGQHWLISGNTASGKTTLTKTLQRKTRLFSGTIRFPFLQKPESYAELKKRVRVVSFTDTSKLFNNINEEQYYQQRYNAFDAEGYLTVREYLEHGGYDQKNAQHNFLLEKLEIISSLDLERIKLSSGQTRKLILSKALLHKPKILILDNPYIGLDAKSRGVFNQILDNLVAEHDITLILSGHGDQLPKCVNSRIHLNKGEILKIEKEIHWNKNKRHQKSIDSKQDLNFDQTIINSLKKYFHKKTKSQSFQKVLEFKNIKIQYEKKNILEKINWEIRPGEKWALLGPNGSGKSTILSLIYGDHPQAYANHIYLFDKKRGSGESIWDIKKKIGFTSPEIHTFFKYNFRALEIVLTGFWDGFIIRKTNQENKDLVQLFFKYFNIQNIVNHQFNDLSTGEQRLLFFLRALVKAPPVLLLDEPFQGLDPDTIAKSKLLLSEILTQKNTLIFITHFKNEIPMVVDKVFDLANKP